MNMQQNPTPKQGDRPRAPRSPFGLPQKRPRPPPKEKRLSRPMLMISQANVPVMLQGDSLSEKLRLYRAISLLRRQQLDPQPDSSP